jgi:hypothetical protein
VRGKISMYLPVADRTDLYMLLLKFAVVSIAKANFFPFKKCNIALSLGVVITWSKLTKFWFGKSLCYEKSISSSCLAFDLAIALMR